MRRWRKIFEQVRETRSFALADLRNNVIPIIQESAIQGTPLIELFASLQAKDDYTYRHHIGVGAISSLIGSWLRLGHKDLLQLTTAALLHDVGKMLIPEAILNKPGQLTPEEGVILMINVHAPIHPLIQVDNQYIDLSKDYSRHIRQIRND